MKRKYTAGGIYRAEMGEPPMPDEGKPRDVALAEEIIAYRKRPDYYGYEDFTPSGRAALRAYNEAEVKATDRKKPKDGRSYPFSPSAAKKAQAVQRETAAEIKRETRGTVPEGMYAKGGSASSRADGCVQRGKTRGKFV